MRTKTSSFITEILLKVDQAQERTLLVRLDCARQVYNACLGEALRRSSKMKASSEYIAAKRLPRGTRQRSEAFAAARKQFGFREYDLHAYATDIGRCWLGDHLDSNTIQKVATRAFQAVLRYVVGKGGEPRFKGKGQFDSVEGKTNKQGILWRDNAVRWLGIELAAIIDADDKVVAHGLQSPIKYVRIVRRKFGERNRFFAQLVCEGLPYRKPKNVVSPGVVGLDIGPSTVAIVGENYADLRQFCDEIEDKSKEIARLQRRIERQRRAANAQNYQPDRWIKNANGNWQRKRGKIKQGKHDWKRSVRMACNQTKLSDLHRKLAAHRKSLQGKLVNDILALGSTVKIEKLSYKAFQRMYGKSVGKRAPGMFVEMLRRKAASAGGAVIEFDTRTTRLSQTCHGCGSVEKKPLGQRWHVCDCGVIQQRDLYSALLATCVEDNRLVASMANDRYAALDYVLRAAASRTESVIGQAPPASFDASQANIASFVVERSQNGSPAFLQSPGETHRIVPLREPAPIAEPPAFRHGE